jgi:hypothetical protein
MGGGNICPTEEQELDRIMQAIERLGDDCTCEMVTVKAIVGPNNTVTYTYTICPPSRCPKHGLQYTFVVEVE